MTGMVRTQINKRTPWMIADNLDVAPALALAELYNDRCHW
jgi:hypothetical protein